jgi:hypothetical protein
MQTGWLAQAGPYKIEHVPCPDYAGDVDTSAPAKGVLHTTEGGWDGSLGVFRQHYAPHFMVGPGRIAQLLPLGRAAAALEHPAGSIPTNGVVRAQIEIVGHSSHLRWVPDAKTLDALAWLMYELQEAAGIPLQHFAPARNPRAFAAGTGWTDHANVPANSHWDVGAMDWSVVLAKAKSHGARAAANAKAAAAIARLKKRTGYFSWLAWYLGEGDWRPYGPHNSRVRPNVSRVIAAAWWVKERAFIKARGQ